MLSLKNTLYKFSAVILSLCILAIFISPYIVLAVESEFDPAFTGSLAQGEFKPLTEELPVNLFTEGATLSTFFNDLFRFSIIIGGLLAVLMIAWSGWEWMTTDIIKNKGEAKERIQNALIGLLMLLGTVLVLSQINPDIVSLRILESAPEIQAPSNPDPSSTSSSSSSGSGTSGTVVDTPFGYCVSLQSGQFLCYDTNSQCVGAYGSTLCESYSGPGTGYDEYAWRNAGFDDNGNVNHCSALEETGEEWVNVDSRFCNGAVQQSGYRCCGITYLETETPSLIGGEVEYPRSALSTVPNGRWCYLSTDTAFCLTTEAACINNYSIRLETTDPTLQSCEQVATNSVEYSDYRHVTELESETSGGFDVCASVAGQGYVPVALSACGNNPFGQPYTSGTCCALPSN